MATTSYSVQESTEVTRQRLTNLRATIYVTMLNVKNIDLIVRFLFGLETAHIKKKTSNENMQYMHLELDLFLLTTIITLGD